MSKVQHKQMLGREALPFFSLAALAGRGCPKRGCEAWEPARQNWSKLSDGGRASTDLSFVGP
jgi:hypothetical protein